jgi:hypothetical protein
VHRERLRQARRRLVDVQAHQFRRVGGIEDFLAAQHLVDHDAEAVEVGARVDLLAEALLRAHVARRRQQLAGDRQRAVHAKVLGEAEVDDHRTAVGSEQDVRRLEIAVHDPPGVDGVEGAGDLQRQAQRRARRQALVDARRQRARGQELHGDVGLVAGEALVVDARHVLVIEAREQLVLAHEALAEDGVGPQPAIEHLQRHAQAVVLALGEVDRRLPALSDRMDHGIPRDQLFHRFVFCHRVLRFLRGKQRC